MRCPICLEADALDILDEEKNDQIYICTRCEATGTRKNLEIRSLNIIDDRYAYFFCECLQIGLFYRSSFRTIQIHSIANGESMFHDSESPWTSNFRDWA